MDVDFDPDLDGPGTMRRVMVLRDKDAYEVQLKWGFPPVAAGGKLVSLLRSENWEISRPCLLIANEFALKKSGKLKYAASLISDEPFMCLAGVWRPARRDWPASFAALTVPAYPDLEPYKDRHIAVVRPDDWYHWLMQSKPKDEILRPFPVGSFDVIAPGAGRNSA